MSHPLRDFEVQGVNIKCFDDTGSGFFYFAPITVIIGKNNSGKSTVIDILDISINLNEGPVVRPSQQRDQQAPFVEIKQATSEALLAKGFNRNTSGGHITGNHFHYATGNFLEGIFEWRMQGKNDPELRSITLGDQVLTDFMPETRAQLNKCSSWTLAHCSMLRVAAERSVTPERSTNPPNPEPSGRQITNLIRYFINSDTQPRDVVEVDLLDDLNSIYSGDSRFTSIICQENESSGAWEIFLREDGKSDVRLSESGSSLQSAFIILSFLRLVPLLRDVEWSKLILVVEEPENNLHPALLRRLLEFLAERRTKLGFSLVMTTHSPVCIDWSTRREDTALVHVKRDETRSKCENVMDYKGQTQVLDDLDVRGSDLLQSNGIIWVEGPSDRVYLKRWIDLESDGALIEGAHYSFMYYGGKVLSHFEAVPESEFSQLLSMVTVNRNIAIVMDSDRKPVPGSTRKPPLRINATKRRLRDEVQDHGGMVWVTEGREIENYVGLEVWKHIVGDSFTLKNPYIDIPSLTEVKAVKTTKVTLAHEIAPHISKSDMDGHLDLKDKVIELVDHIKKWNVIS
ncbi:ATP-dependent nuclease [Litoreibacter albidus]|uniref:ATP-dependent nuclease n=1 Tax=Litoreibacter albidus TaxID=670155 RepID=UPI0037364B46